MDHGTLIIGKEGSRIFWAQDAWRNYCAIKHIVDPFELIRKIKDEYHHYQELYDEDGHWRGTQVTIDDPTEDQLERIKEAEIYRDKYMADREIWVGKYLLKKYGYDTLSNFAQSHRQGESAQSYDKAFYEWFRTVLPCDGSKGDCSIFCPHFDSCDFTINIKETK